MEPWIRPFKDVLLMHYPRATIEKMMREDVIEVSPLATMRGSSFNNSWIICDEAQNTTPKQMLMMLTRIGMNSKIVITGDPEQFDYGFENNGLSDILVRLQYLPEKDLPYKWVEVVEFDECDVERHPAIPHILSLYK
jgi:phosphate starvation-inducible PhoH-like protein